MKVAKMHFLQQSFTEVNLYLQQNQNAYTYAHPLDKASGRNKCNRAKITIKCYKHGAR